MRTRLQTVTRDRRRRGFTLIELLVVILILATLAAMIMPRLIDRSEQAKVAAAQSDLARLNTLLEAFRLDVGRYPTTDEGLFALMDEPSDSEGWTGPYLTNRELPLDPWGIDYIYESDGDLIFLASYGKDGVPEGEDYDADLIERED